MGQYIFPYLRDDKEFENLVADCYRKIYSLKNEAVDIYGRNGQKQYGIDITVQLEKELWCIQCKNQLTMSVNDIRELISKCTFYDRQPFQKLIIATAASNDTRINDHLMKVRMERTVPYDIEYLYWDRICDYIEHIPGIYSKYYGKIDPSDPLRSRFFELIKEYEITAFLRTDPIIEGLSIDTPEKIDMFVLEIQNALDASIGRNDILYRKIYEFRYFIDNYSGNLGVVLFTDYRTYDRLIYLPPYSGVDSRFEEKNNMVLYFRSYLNQLLEIIIDL